MKIINQASLLLIWSMLISPMATYGQHEISNADLPPGREFTSPNGQYFFVFQGDGNLVVYPRGQKAIWASGTNGQGATRCVMQGDGNLVIYSNNGAIWDTKTNGINHLDTKLVMQDDGNMVLLWQTPNTVVPLWSSIGGKWTEKEINDFVEKHGGWSRYGGAGNSGGNNAGLLYIASKSNQHCCQTGSQVYLYNTTSYTYSVRVRIEMRNANNSVSYKTYYVHPGSELEIGCSLYVDCTTKMVYSIENSTRQ